MKRLLLLICYLLRFNFSYSHCCNSRENNIIKFFNVLHCIGTSFQTVVPHIQRQVIILWPPSRCLRGCRSASEGIYFLVIWLYTIDNRKRKARTTICVLQRCWKHNQDYLLGVHFNVRNLFPSRFARQTNGSKSRVLKKTTLLSLMKPTRTHWRSLPTSNWLSMTKRRFPGHIGNSRLNQQNITRSSSIKPGQLHIRMLRDVHINQVKPNTGLTSNVVLTPKNQIRRRHCTAPTLILPSSEVTIARGTWTILMTFGTRSSKSRTTLELWLHFAISVRNIQGLWCIQKM